MKKAILIVSVLGLLVCLAAPVVVGILFADGVLEYVTAPVAENLLSRPSREPVYLIGPTGPALGGRNP